MKNFVKLFKQVDQTTKTNAKIAALVEFFQQSEDEDKMWAMALFSHKRPRRTINTTLIREWAAEASQLPLWLFEESYHIVGDLAETIALVLPDHEQGSDNTLSDWIRAIIDQRDKEEGEKKAFVQDAWKSLDKDERFLFNKLITGGFRIGVSQKLMVRALAKAIDMDEKIVAHRLMGDWSPLDTTFQQLLFEENPLDTISRPYPFYLAYALDEAPGKLGPVHQWYAERKWDGIRGQIIVRNKELFVWSRGEELVTDKFPEFQQLLEMKENDYVLDGEIICYKEGQILPFNQLQTRIGRKNVAKKHLTESPVVMIAYDILEYKGEDLRELPFHERREILVQVVNALKPSGVMLLSQLVPFQKWADLVDEREISREYKAEGLMLKRKDSTYRVGRKRGDWWKWKVDPMTVDAVMIYAQRGHGRRANLYTDFTFAVFDEEGKLVPFTKAYSGLTDVEFREISRWVRKNTLERFGPVCSVPPTHVFEVAFEGIAPSSRHKSGIALRFPRIKRWRKDKPVEEIDTLKNLKDLL